MQKLYAPPPKSLIDFYFPKDKNCPSIDLYKMDNQYRENYCFRKNDNDNLTKPSILLFGCSFTYGLFLEDEQALAYKLSKATQRPVYNKAMRGGGIQHMYYLVQEGKIFDSIDKKPEYVIYVYIADHINRLRRPFMGSLNVSPYIRYKLEGNKLVLKNLPFFWKSVLVRSFLMFAELENLYFSKNKQKMYENFALINELFLQSRAILEERYPGIKFVILKYSHEGDSDVTDIPFLWTTLKDEGFIVIDTKDLTGKILDESYTVADKYHPNEAAWDLIVPKLVQKLKL